MSKIEDGEHLVLDFLVATASLAGFLEDRVEVRLPEGRLILVSRDALLRMKRLAARPQDLADLDRLEGRDP